MDLLIKPKEVTLDDMDGVSKTFIVSRMPATVGREVVAKYVPNIIPRVGEYLTNEAMMYLMMQYVAVPMPGDAPPLRLATKALVNSHCNDWEVLAKLERAMVEHNTSFFTNEKISTFFGDISQNLKAWAMSMLTDLLAASSKQTKQP